MNKKVTFNPYLVVMIIIHLKLKAAYKKKYGEEGHVYSVYQSYVVKEMMAANSFPIITGGSINCLLFNLPIPTEVLTIDHFYFHF